MACAESFLGFEFYMRDNDCYNTIKRKGLYFQVNHHSLKIGYESFVRL